MVARGAAGTTSHLAQGSCLATAPFLVAVGTLSEDGGAALYVRHATPRSTRKWISTIFVPNSHRRIAPAGTADHILGVEPERATYRAGTAIGASFSVQRAHDQADRFAEPHRLAGHGTGQDVQAFEVATVDSYPADDAGRCPIARSIAFDVHDELRATDVPAVAPELRYVAGLRSSVQQLGELPGALFAEAATFERLHVLVRLSIDDVPVLTFEGDVRAGGQAK